MSRKPGSGLLDWRDAAVPSFMLPGCEGVRGALCGFRAYDDGFRFAGGDGRWRCKNCNRIHWEMVYSETKGPGDQKHA